MRTYIVQPGDTLYTIAQRFGVSIQDIANANNLTNLNFLLPGQVLRIPVAEPQPGAPRRPIGPLPIPILRRGSVDEPFRLARGRPPHHALAAAAFGASQAAPGAGRHA